MTGRLGNTKRGDFRHRGFTLVELLVTITIVGILASAVVFAMGTATESAKESKTRAMIAKLHNLLMPQWESYRTRRIPLPSGSSLDPLTAADVRLAAIRELMQIEMPDRWSDIILDSVENYPPNATTPARSPLTGIIRTSISNAYLRKYFQITSANPDIIRSNQGAECLYLVITMATGEGEALEQFSDNEIGDTDQDGALEFLDAWGRPISFLRWAPGFESELQTNYDVTEDTSSDPSTYYDLSDHDPFDPMRRDGPAGSFSPSPTSAEFLDDFPAFRLVPLIYSSGSDEINDIQSAPIYYQGHNPYLSPEPSDLTVPWLGTPRDALDDGENWHDNIHNHLLGLR